MNDIKSPPNNQRAERAVLGSMLISRAAAELALRRLEPADFYQEELKAIFQAILDLRSEFPDSPVDLVTVGSKIRNIQLLTECEHDVGTAHHIEYYVKLVRDLSLHRKILAQAYYIKDDQSLESIKKLEELSIARRANRGKNLFRFKEDLGPMMDDVIKNGKTPGIQTGLHWFDEATPSHLHPEDGELWTIGSRPSGGKSATLIKLGCAMAQQGHETLIFTSEMRTMAVLQRILSPATRIHHKKFRLTDFRDDEVRKIVEVCGDLSEYPISIAEYPNPTINDLMSAVYEAKPKAVIIDYLGRFRLPRAENTAYAIQEFYRQLKSFLLEEEIVGFIGAQTARELDKSPLEKPTMSCLRGSAGIEHESTGVILLWEPSVKAISKIPDWIVPEYGCRGMVGIFAKNRDNPASHESQLQLDGHLIDIIERIPKTDGPRISEHGEQEFM